MPTDAIQLDVPEVAVEVKEMKEPVISAREAAMEALAASRNAEFEQEAGIKTDAPVVAVSVPTDPDVDPDAQLAAQLATDEPKLLNDGLDKYRVKVKIDGQESEVSIADMQREYQKNGAADRRMADAVRLQRENQELQDKLQQQLQAPAAKQDPVDVDTDTSKQFTTALFAGDQDTANQAFATAVSKAVQAEMEKSGRSNATQVDPAQIVQQVKQQMVVESALEQSKKDYPQLYADPDMEELGAAKLKRKMNDEGMSFTDAIKSVGTEFATKFGWQTEGRPDKTATTTARDIKLEKKAGIDNVHAINTKTVTTEEAQQSAQDVIAELRRARGQ